MSRGKAERNSRGRAHVWLGRASALFAFLFALHVIFYLAKHTPPGLLSVHGVATIGTLILACTLWLAQRWDIQRADAVQEGRAETFDEKFAELEERIEHS